ncbi:MAG: hypothetical protein PHS96_04075 [Anaerolineales bacterium]|nr:hypothetical protein [Anaerolineales bacterium]
MKTGKQIEPKNTWRLLTGFVVLFVVAMACGFWKGQPPATPTPTTRPTRTPKIGERVFGVECQPAVLDMLHGETKEIALVDAGGEGKVTDFKVSSVVGPANDPGAGEIEVSQAPATNQTGWSLLPGQIQIHSNAVHGPPHTKTYLLNTMLGGVQGETHILGGNIWCQVNVKHDEPATQTPTPTNTPSGTPTPAMTNTPGQVPSKATATLFVPTELIQLTLSSDRLVAGDKLTVRGSGFTPNEMIKEEFTCGAHSFTVETWSDNRGKLISTINTHDIPPGTCTVLVIDVKTGRNARAKFRVLQGSGGGGSDK